MEKKYVLTDETITLPSNKVLHRIKALKKFDGVEEGQLGGFIEKESNLSQTGDAWVFDDAKVFDNAKVLNDAVVFNNSRIYGNAKVFGRAIILDNSCIYGNAEVSDKVGIYNNARVFGDSCICDNASIFGNAKIFDWARVFNNACVYDNAEVFGDAHVGSFVHACKEAKISQNHHAHYGIVKTDLSKDLISSIKAQCNLPVINNKVIAYKLVRPNLTSFYDKFFHYKIGEDIEVKDYDKSNDACTNGLHFSNLTYWELSCKYKDYAYLEAEIDIEDIITVQIGKIRCRKAKILRSFTLE